MHLGHAYSALVAFDAARAGGGRLLLRIEDTDAGRCRPEYEAAILADLDWLGVDWAPPLRRQSQHMADYAAALDRLIEAGLVYRCFRTRRELLAEIAHAPHGAPEAVRPGPSPQAEEAERLAAGEPFAWRLWLDRCRDALGRDWASLGFEADGAWVKADPARLGDVVLARKEFPASYHLASTHDDALQGVTDVIRGEDLRDAAHLHALLQMLMGWPTPRYRHHRLITGPDGKRLAKRDKAQTLASLRAEGVTPDQIRQRLGLF